MRTVVLLGLCVALGGCRYAAIGTAETDGEQQGARLAGADALRHGRWAKANALIEQQLLHDPANPYLNFLNGLAYQRLAASNGDYAAYAEVGYLLCLRHDPNFAPAAVRLALMYYRMRHFGAAYRLCRQALVYEPENVDLLLLAATSAYLAGAPGEAAEMLGPLGTLAPENPVYERNAVPIYAAAGETAKARAALDRYRTSGADASDVRYLERRLDEWERYRRECAAAPPEPVAEGPEDEAEPEREPLDTPDPPPRMAVVEVVILQISSRDTSHTGVNLLDGLRVQLAGNDWAYQDVSDRVVDFEDPTGARDTRSTTSTLNAGVNLPTITYNLNIFNRGDSHTRVLAHPTLLLTDGREAQFEFANTLYVAIASREDVELDEITAGLTLRLTPRFLGDDLIELDTYAQLDHFVDLTSGTFANKAGTQATTLTVDPIARMGQTVVLSGLTQTFDQSRDSHTPLLGKVPVVNTFFRDRGSDRLHDSVIILLTPRPAPVGGPALVTDSRQMRDTAFYARVAGLAADGREVSSADRLEQVRFRQFRQRDVVVDRGLDSTTEIDAMIDRALQALQATP